MGQPLKISLPLSDEAAAELKAGDNVLFSGYVYTARDAAHKRMYEALEAGHELPVSLDGEVIYYVGPTPARPGEIIGSAGPTTSSRMDKFTPALLDKGLKGMIGKGYRSQEVIDSLKKNKAVYFSAIGGSGALLAKSIKKTEIVAYDELGTEAIRRMEIEDFPAVVINDIHGDDWYKMGVKKYSET